MKIENHFQNESLHVAPSAPSNLEVGDGPSLDSEGMGALSQSQSIAPHFSESTSHKWEDLLDDPSLSEISNSTEELKKGKNPKRKTVIKHNDKNTKREVTSFSFRKEKYTTAVKNWLNHMDTDTALNSSATLKDSFSPTPRAFGETVKIKNTQQFTQSQLANKNGVMKYVNPREINTNENTTHKVNFIATGKTLAELENLQKRKQKASPKLQLPEAINNSKFVAPLKRHSMTHTLASRDHAQRDN
ncbi:unnamed protein product [Pieris macdunnoughi]|uniref:Uncharacterized protein n=1 Tax=Pieris macdunnoughi TaxID=345717 RepID=A0A821Y3U2_9NEOP|nr:unnamed protein product [Pieris macdunnoughi]